MISIAQSAALTVILAFIIRLFVIQPFIVEGSSMEPSFHDRQYIIIDKVSYKFRQPHRGEVIVLHPPSAPEQNYIKRIIGLPGETVSVKNGEVTINGAPLTETYTQNETIPTTEVVKTTLETDQYFVLGDNRAHSSDSREFGALQKENIEGRTWFVAFPTTDFHFIPLPKYQLSFGQTLLHVALNY